MSLMTEMLVIAYGEDDAIVRLNQWCHENDPRHQQFARLDTDAAGGSKVFCDQVWAMCGNYFPHHKLIEAFPTFGWHAPRHALLVVDHEHDETTRTVRGDGLTMGETLTGWEGFAG